MNNKLDASNNQCPHCGARELYFDKSINKYKCSYCNSTFDENKELIIEKDLTKLDKEEISEGSKQLNKSITETIVLKCPGCGAEIIINTKEEKQARCHWCHGILNLTNKIANGSIPDAILPFSVTKEEANTLIEEYISKKKFFTKKQFKKEFNIDDLVGVYYPYLINDINAHCEFIGKAEQTKKVHMFTDDEYIVDINCFNIKRSFDLIVDDLTYESKIYNNDEKIEITNNIINAIQPFDTENIIKYSPHYLIGYHSENRNIDLGNIREDIDKQLTKIARHTIGNTLTKYDRGFAWTKEIIVQKGSQTITAYLPIWLYTFHEKNNKKEIIHYIAINGRTKEIIGSIPINKTQQIITSLIASIPGIILLIYFLLDKNRQYKDVILNDDEFYMRLVFKSIFAITLIIVLFTTTYKYIYKRYRNQNSKHIKDKETKYNIKDFKQEDNFIEEKKDVTTRYIQGINKDSLEDYK